ncbi:MAG: hypothetical protein ACYDD0_02680 [Candidatus Dormibacteria bacterium]
MFHRNDVIAMSDQDLDDLIKQTVLADATEALHRDASARVTSLVRQRLESPPRGRFVLRWRLGIAAVLAVTGLSGAVAAAALLPTKPIRLVGPLPAPATTSSVAPNQPGLEFVSLAQAQALVPFQILPLDYPNAPLQKVLYTPPELLANGLPERSVASVSLFYQVGSLQIQLAESLNPQGALTLNQKPLPPGATNPDQIETIDGSQYLVSRHTSGSGVTGVTAITWQTAQNVVVSMFWYTPSANGGIPVPMTFAKAMNLVQSVS